MSKIKDVRLRLGENQKDFARRLEITPGAVSHYETGKRTPCYAIASRIVSEAEQAGLHLTIADLLAPRIP